MITEKRIKELKDYKELIVEELFNDLEKDMSACACDYHRHKMLSSIIRTSNEIDDMIEKNGSHEEMEEYVLTPSDAKKWVDSMKNNDGVVVGEQWSIAKTTEVGKQYGINFTEFSESDFYVVMNMMYSNYADTLKASGITDVSVFVGLSKNFLLDKDSVPPDKKLCYYYKYIFKK